MRASASLGEIMLEKKLRKKNNSNFDVLLLTMQANADFLFPNSLFLISFENSFVFRYRHEPGAGGPLQPGRGLVPGWLQHLPQQQPW